MGRNAFWLKNVGATYQRVMNSIIHYFIETFMQVYIDDIVIKSASGGGYLDQLRRSFERMRKHGLKMNPMKSDFCAQVLYPKIYAPFCIIHLHTTKHIMHDHCIWS